MATKLDVTAILIEKLRRNHSFLFDRYGFTITYEERGGRYNTEPIVGLSNASLQLLFHDRDEPIPDITCTGIPFVGTVDESLEDARIYSKYWVPSFMLFFFLDGDAPPTPWSREDWAAIRQRTWQKLENRLPEVEVAFSSVEKMREWMPAYLRFLEGRDAHLDAAKREWLAESDAS